MTFELSRSFHAGPVAPDAQLVTILDSNRHVVQGAIPKLSRGK